MSSVVEYILELKDNLSPKIEGATSHIKAMEGSIGSLKNMAIEAVGALGVSFAVFKGWEFVHEGVEKMHELHAAEAQVRAGLESTRGAAGLTAEDLEKSAKALASQFTYSRSQVTEMQSVMLTFPGITQKTFRDASQAILDMSTRLHKGLDETALMVGKALQDPERGITAMRRVGVNFNDTQTEIIKKLVETGHAGKAQAMILQELQTEFAGSAEAAADADPLFRFNKIMGSIKMEAGGAAMELLHSLTPALESIANATKDTIEFIKRHKELVIDIGIGAGIATGAFIAYTAAIKTVSLWTAVTTAYTNAQALATAIYGTGAELAAGKVGIITIAQWAWNTAMTANPIGMVVAGIAGLTATVTYCWKHFEKFREIVMGTWEVIKAFASGAAKAFWGLGEVITGALNINPSLIAKGLSDTVKGVKEAASSISAFQKGAMEGAASWATSHFLDNEMSVAKKINELQENGKISAVGMANAIANLTADLARGVKSGYISEIEKGTVLSLIPKTQPGKKGATGDNDSHIVPSPKTKAEGQKNINIHITINGGLVHNQEINTTHMHEAPAKIRDMVAAALVGAVNDSQIIGDF